MLLLLLISAHLPQVKAVVVELKQNRKIATASHNILAYRQVIIVADNHGLIITIGVIVPSYI